MSRITKILQGLRLYSGRGVRKRECQSTLKQAGGREASPEHWLPARSSDRRGAPPHLCIDSSCPCCSRTTAAVDTWGSPTTVFRDSTKSLLSLPCREETCCQGRLQTPRGHRAAPVAGGVALEWGRSWPPSGFPHSTTDATPRSQGSQALPVGPPEANPLYRRAPSQTIVRVSVSVQKCCHLGKNKNQIHSTERGTSGLP